jgi:hypothetical protein
LAYDEPAVRTGRDAVAGDVVIARCNAVAVDDDAARAGAAVATAAEASSAAPARAAGTAPAGADRAPHAPATLPRAPRRPRGASARVPPRLQGPATTAGDTDDRERNRPERAAQPSRSATRVWFYSPPRRLRWRR